MNIEISGNRLTVEGEVNTISRVQEFKEKLQRVKDGGEVTIYFKDATVLPSSLLGTLLKMIKADGINTTVEYSSEQIGSMLDRMQLKEIFRARRV